MADEAKTAHKGLLYVIEVQWMRRKGKPVEVVGLTTGGTLQALILCAEVAKQLKVPRSWVHPIFYRRCKSKLNTTVRIAH